MTKALNLSHPQKRIWLTDEMHQDLEMSNVGLLVRLNVPVFDPDVLEKAINELIRNDQGTRIRLRNSENEDCIEQIVSDYRYMILDRKDFSGKSIDEIESYFRKRHNMKFDMLDSDLFYFCIVKLSEDEGGFYLKAHHLISDGNSAVLNIKKIIRFYKEITSGKIITDMTANSYLDYLEAERAYLNSVRCKTDSDYWHKVYETLPEPVNIASKNGNKGTQEVTRTYYSLDKEMSGRLIDYVKENNYSVFGIFLEIISIYIYKFSRSCDFSIGIPTHNRYDRRFADSSGMFVSTLPFRVRINENETIRQFHDRLRSEMWKSLKHQKYPFDMLIGHLVEKQKTEVNLLNVQLVEIPGFFSEELEVVRHFAPKHSFSELSVFINLRDKLKDNIVEFSIDYQKDLFSVKDIDMMSDRLKNLFLQYFNNPGLKICEIDPVCPEDVDLIESFNNTLSEDGELFLSRFNESVKLYPLRTAITDKKKNYSYEQIDRLSDIFAKLVYEADCGKNAVAVIMKKSVELIISILGILKAGMSYVPVDPKTPQDRISFMIQNSDIKLVAVDADSSDIVPDGFVKLCVLSEELDSMAHTDFYREINGSDSAYTIYTSGSTGYPKGVSVTHANLSNYINWAAGYYKLEEPLIFPLYSSISFDLTVTSIFVPLASGGSIVVYEEADFENAFLQIFEENQVNTVKMTPSHMRIIQNMKFNSTIKQMIVGGEELTFNLSKTIFRNFGSKLRIINEYGPTEATVGCTVYEFDPDKFHCNTLPIGKPVSNTQILIMNEFMQIMPVGSIGEIYISGKSVAAGYMNNAAETERKFVRNHELGQVLYKSGDLGRWNSEGELEYFGRDDCQVKIRGFRIELEEISSKVEEIDGVEDCIVLDRKTEDNTTLICYYAATNHMESEIIRERLTASLPQYMIPSQFIHIEKMPLTINGKVDKSKLPNPSPDRKKHRDFKIPGDEIEKIIADVWKETLNLDRIGVEENFFELGGDSIKAIQIVSALRSKGIILKVKDIFNRLTIKNCRLSAKVELINPCSNEPVKGEKKLLPIDEWFFHNDFEDTGFYNQSVILKFRDQINIQNIERTLSHLVFYHDGLRLNYDPKKHIMVYNNSFLEHSIFVIDRNYHDADSLYEEDFVGLKVRYGHFDITKELLIRAVVIRCRNNDCLLLIAHHLVIDGVSWRILLKDFAEIYSNLESTGKIINLPSKTDPASDYALYLHELAFNRNIVAQTNYWSDIQQKRFYIEPDNTSGDNAVKHLAYLNRELNKKDSEYLKKDLFRDHGVSVEELMLLATARSVKAWTGKSEMVVEMEGHGRDYGDFDFSRTVGWFTTMYPVLINIKDESVEKQIISVKNCLNFVPDKGIGYGLLKYFHNERLNKNKISEIRFNYLGDLSESNDVFEYIDGSMAGNTSQENTITVKIEVEVYFAFEKLNIIVKYNKLSFFDSTIERFIEEISENIEQIIKFLHGFSGNIVSASSFDTSGLDQDDIDELFE